MSAKKTATKVAKKAVKKIVAKKVAKKAARPAIRRHSKKPLDLLQEAPEPLLELLAGAEARAGGFHLIFRSSTAARENSGYGYGTAGVWRGMHASFEEATGYVEMRRERGVSWEIHPWPALRLTAGETDLLLAPFGGSFFDNLPETLLSRLRKREAFDFWALKWLVDEVSKSFELFIFQKGLPKLLKSELSHYFVSESVGTEYHLRWHKDKSGLGKDVCSRFFDCAEPPTGKRILFDVLKSELAGMRAEYSVANSSSGKILVERGKRITAAHIESIIKCRSSLKVLPESAGRELLDLIALYSPYVR